MVTNPQTVSTTEVDYRYYACVAKGLVQTICGNHNVIVMLSFNPFPSSLHIVTMTRHKNYDDNLH